MKITDEKISKLAGKYAKDNFNNSPTAYYAFKEGMKQAINYSQWCESDSEQLPNMSLEQAIAKAKPNLDKIKDVDKHIEDIR
jgi:hypothetical protein